MSNDETIDNVTPLTPETFDLAGLLSGRDYPSTDIKVYFDEALGFKIHELSQTLPELITAGELDEAKDTQEKIAALVEATKDAQFTIHLQSVSEGVRRSIHDKVEAEHPTKLNFMGQPEPNPQGDHLFRKLLWGTYVRTVTDPQGKVSVVGEREIKSLMDDAPATVQAQINIAINSLHKGAQEGYEFAAKELDFLSSASPEG